MVPDSSMSKFFPPRVDFLGFGYIQLSTGGKKDKEKTSLNNGNLRINSINFYINSWKILDIHNGCSIRTQNSIVYRLFMIIVAESQMESSEYLHTTKDDNTSNSGTL